MSKHTAGPWDCRCDSIDKGFIVINNNRGQCICEKWFCACTDSELDEAFANARLIAAAPDMLQYLIDVYKSGGVFDEAEMRAVIEAATGQKIEEVVK